MFNIISEIISIFLIKFQRFAVNFIFERLIKLTTRLPYSRMLEEEADKVGLMLAAKVYIKSVFKKKSIFLYSTDFRLVMIFVNQLLTGKQSIRLKKKMKISPTSFIPIQQVLNVLKLLRKNFLGH
jgi:hypothetical protein